MTHSTQLERYEKLLVFLSKNFTEDIDAALIESICFYSYVVRTLDLSTLAVVNRVMKPIEPFLLNSYIMLA